MNSYWAADFRFQEIFGSMEQMPVLPPPADGLFIDPIWSVCWFRPAVGQVKTMETQRDWLSFIHEQKANKEAWDISKRIKLANLPLTFASQADSHTKITNMSILVAFSRSISFAVRLLSFLLLLSCFCGSRASQKGLFRRAHRAIDVWSTP